MSHLTKCMLDTETAGCTHDAIILSLAAVKFTLERGVIDKFSVNIDPASSKSYGLKTDKATMDWWKSQPPEVVKAATCNPIPLPDAMNQFCDWYGGTKQTWARGGPNFDYPILENSIKAVGIEKTPWHYRDALDLRTLINLFGLQAVKGSGIAHCALDDCIMQTELLIPLLKVIESDSL